jgi:hypothetical protein
MGDFRALCDRLPANGCAHRRRFASPSVRFCSLPSPCGSTATGKRFRRARAALIEANSRIALRIVGGLAGITVVWTYLIRPEGILWASLPPPGLIRWFGVGAGAIPT